MKITVKQQLNFQELINFIYDNNIKNGKFLPDSNDFINTVWVDNYALEFDDDSYITKDDTWTIEHKVEITKDTKLPSALVYDGKYFKAYYGLSINDIEKKFIDIEKKFIDCVYRVEKIHLINGDTHTLIYKNGELVE